MALSPPALVLMTLAQIAASSFPRSGQDKLGVSGMSPRDCSACSAGDAGFCRLVSGLFTRPQLPVGYNLIAQIPRGVCNINITEMKHSRNYLSLRHAGSGASVLNGNWAMDWSGDYPAVGTIFTYHRHDPRRGPKAGEVIYAPGPTDSPLDLLLVVPHQNPNPGIEYHYHIPLITPKVSDSGVPVFANLPKGPHQSEPENSNRVFQLSPSAVGKASPLEAPSGSHNQNRRRKPRPPPHVKLVDPKLPFQPSNLISNPAAEQIRSGFVWRISEISPCSKSCGGGESRTILTCSKEVTTESLHPVHSQHASSDAIVGAICDPSSAPIDTVTRCNNKPCPAEWVAGEWGPCSATCGEQGIQSRDVWCQQEISPTLRMRVTEGACITLPLTLPRTRPCPAAPCHKRRWITSEWDECSVTCGEGVRRRKVKCTIPRGLEDEIDTHGKDNIEEENEKGHLEGMEAECLPEEKPPEEESCNMGSCSKDNWFFTEWSPKCSTECGTGIRSRHIHCSGGGANDIPGSGFCNPSSRPSESIPCTSTTSCSDDGSNGSWFAGQWSTCASSINCIGDRKASSDAATFQTREIVCVLLTRGQFIVVADGNCSASRKPSIRRSCKINLKKVYNGHEDYDAIDAWNSKDDGALLNVTLPNCQPEWYMTEWSQCSASCGHGHQSREVKCLDQNQQPALECNPQNQPPLKQDCNIKPCSSHVSHTSHQQHHRQHHQKKHTGTATTCKDEFKNCQLVVQARLCHYNYYRNACCNSCGTKL